MSVQINVAANQAALTASIQAGVQAYNQRFAQNNQLNLTINPRAFSQPLGRITGDVKDFEAALAASNARVIAFGASTAVLGGVIRSFKELANVTIEVEKNLADINRVFGLTTSQLQKFSTDLFNVTKQTASSFNDASQAALEFSRQGLKAEETLQRTKDALTLTRLAGISTANAVDALTSTVNGFAATGITTSQILNKLVAVEQDFAVGAGDLAEALSRTGQAAQEAGVSLDQLNALVTSAQQSTARGGAVIGNALKTIFTRLQRTDTLDQLEAFNISVRDVQGNILPAVTILQNFAGAYKNLADAQRAQLSEQVAGVYQVNILKAIVNDLNKSQGVYAGALQRGAMATNEAEVATAKLNQTLDALLKQTATSTQQLANNIGKVTFEPLARYGTEQLKSLVESMNEILEGEGIGSTFANGLLKGIRNILAGPGAIAAFFTLFKLIQNSFTYLSQALPQIAGITTETQNRKNIEQSILQIMAQQGPVAQALAGTMGNQAAQAQLLLQVARQQTAEYQTQTALARQLAAQLAGQGVRVRGSGGLQVTRAGGYIPASTKLAEVVGAQAGGYSPGRVVPSPVGGVMNTAEDVKYIPGFAQPFINPPARSKAGRAHRQNAINRTGIDPYMASGFIPNFVKGVDLGERGKEFEKLINFHLINEKTSAGSNLLDFALPSNALTKASFKDKNKISLNPLSFYGDAKIKSTKETQKDLIKKLVGSLDEITYGKLITRANKIKSNVINLNDFLPVKPSLISSKSSITKDNENASVESVLGFDVIEKLQRLMKNDATQRLTGDAWENKKLKLSFIDDYVTIPDFSNSGFIPNFAPPTSAIRVPWFKKFGNASFDAIQPTLGISKASDLETFRQINFRSKAKGADKVGDSNIFAPLYEDFVFKALQLVSQPKIKDQLIRGYVLQPGSDQKQSAFDAFVGNVAFEKKGFPKENLPGSISKNLNDKYERFAKANPSEAAKIKESIMIFNEVGHENQLPSDFGKNFTQLAGTSYSQMVKNSPDLVKGLSEETNMLLNRYVKDPAFLAMSSAKGFIPNFGKDILTRFYKTQTGPELFSSKGTGLSGTVYRQPGYKSYGYQLKEQLNNMVMSILGNNVFFPDASSLNPKIYGDVNKGAENFAKNAALRLSSGGKTSSLGLGSGMMNETFGNSRLNLDPEAVYTGQVSGRMKRVNYDRLSDVLGAFWSGNPQTKSAWESLKNLSESGKFEEKESIRAKTSLLKKAYEEFLIKNNYIGTRVKLSSYRKRAEGVEGVNYGSLRSDLAGVSDVRNLGKNNGFVPNFADLDTGARSMLVNSGTIPFVVDLERRRIAESSAADDIFHSEIVNKKFIDPKTKKPIYPKLYKDDIHSAFWKDTFVRGFVDSGTGKVHFDLTTPQKEDKNFIQKYSVLLEQVRNKYAKKFEEAINEIKSTPQRNQQKLSPYQQSIKQLGSGPYPVNHFNNGFIPNFNFIKGRNSFQKNWLIETAKKRNLNLNDPNVFHQLATEFAKTYPNDQGMFGLSKGFIPNFAYKQSVMSLEENMSGNKAIFDTKPFPHIRNSSQPTFSSAISDHGGLGNALSDSMRGQKAAGLMNKGFIPNFGPIRSFKRKAQRNKLSQSSVNNESFNPEELNIQAEKIAKQALDNINNIIDLTSTKIQSLIGKTSTNLLSSFTNLSKTADSPEFKQKISNMGTTLAFAGPMAAGLIEQSVFGNRQRTDMSATERQVQSGLSTGLTAASTGASIGSAFGPWGAAIGLAAGAAVGLAQSLGAASLSADELRQVADEYKSKTQENISSAQNYIDTLKTLNTSTDPDIIKKASESLAENFSNIKDVNLQEIFQKTGTDVKKLGDALTQYEKDRKKMQNESEEDFRAAQAGQAKSAKDLTKLGYTKAKTIKGPGLASDFTFLEFKKETDDKILSDYKETFSDLSSLSDQQVKDFSKLISEQKASVYFDKDVVSKFLKDQGMNEGMAEMLTERFDALEDTSNIVGNYLIDNLIRLFDKNKQKIETVAVDKNVEKKLTNDFIKFKNDLTEKLSDNLIAAANAVKSFEFKNSMTNLISNKLKEINDSIFSSISGNLTELGAVLVKASQLESGRQFQQSQLATLRQQTQKSASLKNVEARASYLKQSRETVFSSGGVSRSPESQQKITDFLSTSLNKTRKDFQNFASSLSLSDGEAKNLAVSLEENQRAFREKLNDSKNELLLKQQEFDLTELTNKINYQTGLEQLKLETEKLKITYAQRDATLQLRKDVESYKITSAQSLELKKIDIGSEFRYLGLGKRETFASQQTDQKAIFDEEQKIAQKQAILDARRSIIEIASQEANTAAQDANTEAVLRLVDLIAQQQLEPYLKDIAATKNGSPENEAALGRFSEKATQVSNITSANASLRKAYSERRNVLSYKSLSDFGVTNEMSIKEAIDKLESSKAGKDKTTINAIDNTIQDLTNASDALGSNATIYAAKVAQAKSDFEQSAGFVNNIKIGFQSLTLQSDQMVDQLGRNLPAMFGDGLVDGIKAAIRESDNLGEALMGIAAKFLDEISTTLMRSSVYQILGSMGIGSSIPIQKQRGGVIRAQSGMYISGSGSGDKYPAMLENGEYVLNRKAVMAMGGPAELDKLNFSMAPRFASGGSFSNKFEDISSMESNMTTFGLEESKLYNELRDQKRQEAEAARQRKRARRQQMAGIIGSLAGAAVTLGLSAGIKKLNQTPKVDGGYAATSAGQLEIGASGDAGPSAEGLSIVQNQAVFATSRPKFGGRQVGGSIGSRLSDTIPGYATGGVFETPIVKRYALGGQTAGIGFGGTAGNSSTVNNNTNANNSFSFNTTVQRDGKIQVGANTTSYAQQDVELSQNLNNKVYEVILDTIRKEKRFGGSLAGVRN